MLKSKFRNIVETILENNVDDEYLAKLLSAVKFYDQYILSSFQSAYDRLVSNNSFNNEFNTYKTNNKDEDIEINCIEAIPNVTVFDINSSYLQPFEVIIGVIPGHHHDAAFDRENKTLILNIGHLFKDLENTTIKIKDLNTAIIKLKDWNTILNSKHLKSAFAQLFTSLVDELK